MYSNKCAFQAIFPVWRCIWIRRFYVNFEVNMLLRHLGNDTAQMIEVFDFVVLDQDFT